MRFMLRHRKMCNSVVNNAKVWQKKIRAFSCAKVCAECRVKFNARHKNSFNFNSPGFIYYEVDSEFPAAREILPINRSLLYICNTSPTRIYLQYMYAENINTLSCVLECIAFHASFENRVTGQRKYCGKPQS